MVHVNGSLHEPNTKAYANFCGPGASEVLISNWTSDVPSITTLGNAEGTDPNSGTLIVNMIAPINKAIGTDYYADSGGAQNQGALSDLIGRTILDGHPLITGVMTGVTTSPGDSIFLNGWAPPSMGGGSGFEVAHIVTIYGFNFTSPALGKIYYVETAGTVAGTNKTGPQEIDYQKFWTLVDQSAVNDQAAKAP